MKATHTQLRRSLLSALCAALLMPQSWAQQSPPEAPATPASPAAPANPAAPAIALIAAVGDQFQYVRQRQQTGSHMEPFVRRTVQLESNELNLAVLRGLASAVEQAEPEAQRVLLLFNPSAEEKARLKQAKNSEREKAIQEALVRHLTAAPKRHEWDRIIAVTPAYQFSDSGGMGSKLSGIGLYVQPLARQSFREGELALSDPTPADGDETTYGPGEGAARKRKRSSVYVAPFFYFNVTTYDAKTMKVLKSERRLDYQKLFDPDSTALRVEDQFTPEALAARIEKLVERSALRSVAGDGTVDVGPIQVVPGSEKK